MEDGDSDLAQSSLLERILENQEAIHGLSEKLMPLLMGNLQRLAESNRPEYDPLVDTETNSDLPRDPRNSHSGRREPAAQHVAGSGESDLRLHAVMNCDDSGNAAQNNPGNAAQYTPGNVAQNNTGNAAQNIPGNVAQNYTGNAAHNTQGNAALNTQGNAAHNYPANAAHHWEGNAAQSYWDNFPPGLESLHGGNGFFPLPLPLPRAAIHGYPRMGRLLALAPHLAPQVGMRIVSPLSSQRGAELASSEDSDESDEDTAPPAKRPKLGKEVTGLLREATEKPLEHEKRKKLTTEAQSRNG